MKQTKNILKIILGSSILSFGLYHIHAVCSISEGGALGLELLIYHWLNISPAITSVIIDGTSYLLGFLYLGHSFLAYALLATASYSLTYSLWEHISIPFPNLASMPLLAAIIGALFVGIGAGIVVKIGGACGGDDAIAMILSKRLKQPIERCYLLTDITVLILSLSYIPVLRIFYSLISVTLSSYIIGWIQKQNI